MTKEDKYRQEFGKGTKHHSWTVLRYIGQHIRQGKLRNYLVEVQCICGKIRKCEVHNLMRNRSKSCGCQGQKTRMQKLYGDRLAGKAVGQKYNKLTILAENGYKLIYNRLGELSRRERRVLAECECGSKREYSYHNIRSGNSRSCGCASKRKTTTASAAMVSQ